jgi:hypothetical protein
MVFFKGDMSKMNKIRITLEIESRRGKRQGSKLEKLVDAFVQLWKTTLVSDLYSRHKTKILVTVSTLITLAYLIFCLLTFVLNHP